MAKYLNLDGLQTLWAKAKNTFALKKHSHTVEDIPVDPALSSTSTNPVQNKVVKSALDGKSATGHAHGYISNTGGLEGTDGSYNVFLNGSRIVDSPAAKYLWHDILAFGRHVGWPSFEQTTDGVNWEEKTLSKIPFLQKDGTGTTVINASNKGARWTWNSGNFGYCGASWLFVGIGYGGDGVKNTTIQVHTSSDGTTWSRRHFSVISNHQRPYLFKVYDAGNYKYLRITLLMEDLSLTSYASVVIQAIKFVTARWGSQGASREYEFPYTWDADCNIEPIENNTKNLGSSKAKWANVYATNFNGALKGNADTASNCNYSGKADANTLVVKRTDTSGGAFIQYLPNNQTENWWRTGSVQNSSKFVFNYKGTDKAFIDTNGAYNGDVKGNASTASAAKSGSALETAISAKQNALTAQTAYNAKGSATKVPKITTNALGQVTDITEVDIDQPDVSGKLNIDASNATSGTANGIFSHSPERPSSESYDVGDNDVLLVQDVGGDSTRRTTVSRLMKKFNGYLVDLGKRITEEVASLNESIGTKISKTDIVQNLSAQNEGKVPSQKAVRYTTGLKLNISGSNATAEGTTAILSTLTEVDDKADDYDYYIFGNDDDHTNMHRKPMSKLWDYIKDKIDAVGDILRIQPKDIGGSGVLNKSFIGGVRQIALDSSDTSNNISSIYSASTMSQYRSYYGVIVVINTGTSSRSVTGFYGGKTATVPANQCIYCARHRIGTTDAFFLGY